MKIAYIATSEIPSQKANSIQVMKVCQALVQIGAEVHLYVPGKTPVDRDELSREYGLSSQFPITRLPSRSGFRRLDFTWHSLRCARQEGADLIYTRMLWVAWFAQRLRMPVILEIHDLPTGKLGPALYKNIIRSRRQKMVVYITHALKRLTDEQTGCTTRETESFVSPDGVDLERYTNLPSAGEARKRLNLPEKFTAAYSGSFYTGRGLDTLLELARAFPNVQFLWIGGPDAAVTSWGKKLADAGVKNVILTGFIRNADLPLYQAAADILLIPYSRVVAGSGGGNIADVSSPLKLFEYMAVGRAILCSDLPVLREILDETNAVFYATDDLGDLIARFSALLADGDKRKSLAQKALADVAQYDWKARMKNIMQAYSKLHLE